MSSGIVKTCFFELPEGAVPPKGDTTHMDATLFLPYALEFWKGGMGAVENIRTAVKFLSGDYLAELSQALMSLGGHHADFSILECLGDELLIKMLCVMQNTTFGAAWALVNIMKLRKPADAVRFALSVSEHRGDSELISDVIDMLFDIYTAIDDVSFNTNQARAICIEIISQGTTSKWARWASVTVQDLLRVETLRFPMLDHAYYLKDEDRIELPKNRIDAMRMIAAGKFYKFINAFEEMVRKMWVTKNEMVHHPKRRSTFHASVYDCASHDLVRLQNWYAGIHAFHIDDEIAAIEEAFETEEDPSYVSDSSSDSDSDSDSDSSDSDSDSDSDSSDSD